ncbi:aldose epimerase family protein [Pedobacter alpinus]|uniref:Aldose 1-epimerase n=1 Tax=Pedobacter alpinus TaxID=1590643 RepID=A0ABW5TUV0_9SPHI
MKNTNYKAFETTIDKLPVKLYTLKNNKGITVNICNYGARITHFIIPQKGNQIDIVLGFNSIDEYINNSEFYYGVTVGRFANRIKDAKFILNNKTYNLEVNNGINSLHSGTKAFHNSVWEVLYHSETEIKMQIISQDGDGGFPGELICDILFNLNDDGELAINYTATTDKDTVVNLTNHAYFNLNGEGSGTILDHDVKIEAQQFVPINDNCTPLGNFSTVEATPFDFREFTAISKKLDFDHPQVKIGNGFDHSFVLNQKEAFNLAATAKGDITGLTLEVYTNQPGMQFYTGNYLSTDVGKSGNIYSERTGFCFETQHHPDSPNQPNFPSTVLKAGDIFTSKTIYKVF